MDWSNILFTILYIVIIFSFGRYLYRNIHEQIRLLAQYREEDRHKIIHLEIRLNNFEEARRKHYTPKRPIKKSKEERHDNPRGSKKTIS